MARLPIYTQQTAVGAPEVSMKAATAPMGAAAQAFGTLADIGAQIQRRQDVIDRVQILGEFDREAISTFEAVQSTGDISKKETIDQFYQGLRTKADDLIGRHKGTAASRAELTAQLYNQVEQYQKTALGSQIRAQHTQIAQNVDQKSKELAITTTFAPNEFVNSLSQFDAHLETLKDAMTPQQLTEYRNSGRGAIVSGAVNGFLQRGDFATARKMLKDPSIGGMLPPNQAQKMVLDISAGEGRVAAEGRKEANNLRRWSSLLNRPLTAEESQRARSVDPSGSNKSNAEQIVELELVTGKKATQADINRIFKIKTEEPGGEFGNSLQGRAVNYVTNNAEAFAAGILPPDEGRRYLAAVNEAYKETYRKDPDTGQWTPIRVSMPQFVQDAVESGSRYYGGMANAPANAQPSAAAPAPTTAPAPAAAPSAMPSATAAPAAAPAAESPQTSPAPSAAGRTVWDRRTNIAGPTAGAKAAVFGVPGVGPAVVNPTEGRAIQADRTYAEGVSRDLIRVLQNNPRFAEGERKAIEQEIAIGPEFFRSVESFEGRLYGINQTVTQREIDARETLTRQVPAEERQRAMTNINAIQQFRRQLGLPAYAPSPDVVRKNPEMYPPGSQIIDSNNKVYIVPGR